MDAVTSSGIQEEAEAHRDERIAITQKEAAEPNLSPGRQSAVSEKELAGAVQPDDIKL